MTMKRTLIAGVAAMAVAGLASPLFADEEKMKDINAASEELATEAKKLTEEELNTIAPAAGEKADETMDEVKDTINRQE
jgi:uncharacterized membrane protein (DUF106 family)